MKLPYFKNFIFVFLILVVSINNVESQQYDCTFKPPILKIDFGNASSKENFNVGDLKNYNNDGGECPQDGYYSISSHTSDCFFGNWITMNEDHTPGDEEGRMMIVNASEEPGTFFSYPINNVTGNTTYEISVWIINICTGSYGCYPTPPNLSFMVYSNAGVPIVRITTGNINPTAEGRWLRYHAQFATPANTTGILLKMNDETAGGCGNDFAIDDITLSECEMQKPPLPVSRPTPVTRKPVIKEQKPSSKSNTESSKPPVKTVVQKEKVPETAALKRNVASIKKEPVNQKNPAIGPTIKERTFDVPAPDVLIKRSNTLVKTIETTEAEMLIELYDNGEIDGDTVTVYHNNSLLVANAGLSAKPISFRIKIDKQHPFHELVMVANNLGSIPPNTSLMIVTANDQRYEVFISSTEQKNARVIIKLKE
jgi:hypothetical protein